MNRQIAKAGAIIVSVTVLLFAAVMAFSPYLSFIICMILPIGYIMMAVGFHNESDREHRVSANVGLIFAGIYAVLIFLVYFAQTTVVKSGFLNDQAMDILDFSRGGLIFNYDLLGYGMMALSTFFIGLSIKTNGKIDKWIKALMMIHGVFFLGCFIMPMTGMFSSMANGSEDISGIIALEFWCIYFLPIGILSIIHFSRKEKSDGQAAEK